MFGPCFVVLSSFAIILRKKRERESWLIYLCSCYHVGVCVQCLFLVVLWVSLWHVIVAFPGHTHLFLSPIVSMVYNRQSCVFDHTSINAANLILHAI